MAMVVFVLMAVFVFDGPKFETIAQVVTRRVRLRGYDRGVAQGCRTISTSAKVTAA